jgi:hypothetical protein
MPDYLFEDHELAALYDLFAPNEGRGDFEFYLPLVMSADSVLDVESLSNFLSMAGLVVEQRHGDWAGGKLTDDSVEIITIAKRA